MKAGPTAVIPDSTVATVTGPVVAVAGTVTVIEVAVGVPVTVASAPLNRTVLFAEVVEKLVPVMVTVVPAVDAVVGERLVMVGAMLMVKAEEVAIADAPASVVCTVTTPVVAPVGTNTVIEFTLAADIEAVGTTVPLNFIVLLAMVLLKPEPEIVTVEPTAPAVGLRLVIVGFTVKVVPIAEMVFTVTETVPVMAFGGTVTVS